MSYRSSVFWVALLALATRRRPRRRTARTKQLLQAYFPMFIELIPELQLEIMRQCEINELLSIGMRHLPIVRVDILT